MSLDYTVYRCDCVRPEVTLDDETGQEMCRLCGGLIEEDNGLGDLNEVEVGDVY